ncbi:MAG: AAA family ATPase [Solirubrobacteraceae bacterium]
MPTPPSMRSVKIGADERGGWTTDRPPREGDAPPRPVDVSTRCRVLSPSDRLRYSPGSLLLIASPDASASGRLAERVVEERNAVLSLAKVRTLLSGRVADEEIETRARELLDAAVVKRLGSRQTVVLTLENLSPAERDRYVRLAHAAKRPRHLILLEVPRELVPEEQRATLNELRTAIDSGEIGREGFQTALRLGGTATGELKRIVFQRPPRED